MKNRVVIKKRKIGLNPLRQRRIVRPCAMGGGCESKMRMLRTNNRDLARALSDQKMEANHWYSEAISLKGELQELQEKLLKMPATNMYVESVFVEAEKQIKECYESMDKDFNTALDRIVQAVERLTKIKQLVGGIQSMLQTSSQPPSSIFSRTPGSRIPLRSNGSSPSPRQRAVPPMVGGHVLQPVMVPLPKLKIDWNGGTRNQFSVQGENGLNMSPIGEESSRENSVVGEGQHSSDAEEELQPQNDGLATPDDDMLGSQPQTQLDVADLQTRLGEDTARRYTLRGKTDPSPEPQVPSPLDSKVSHRRRIQPRRGKERKSERRRNSTSKSSSAKASEHLTLSLEGRAVRTSPTNDDPLEGPSWLLDKSPPQANRTRFRGRRVRVCKKECASVAGEVSSSDENADENEDLSPKFKQNGFQESLSRKKGSSPAIAMKELDVNTMPSTNNTATEVSSPRKIDAGVESVTENNKEGNYNTSSALTTVTSGLPSEDNNTTCRVVTNMDITLPVSNPIIEENLTTFTKKDMERLQHESNPTQPKKKFFKTRGMEVVEEITEKVERTPFDLSMLDESLIKMPAFSSTRTNEKENLPPLSVNRNDESVVLEDVMKQSPHSKTPKRLLRSTQKEGQSAKSTSSNTPRKLRSLSRTLQYTINYSEDSDDIRKPKRGRKPKKKEENKHSLKTDDVLVDSPPNLDMKSLEKRATKLLDDFPEDTDTEPKETRGKEACVLLSDNCEEIKHLKECFVVLQRIPITGSLTPRLDKNSTQRKNIQRDSNVLADVSQQQQQQQPSEDGKNPQGQGPETEATSNVGSDSPSSGCSSSPVNTERNTSISTSTRKKKVPRRFLSYVHSLSQDSGESDTDPDGNSDYVDADFDFLSTNTFDCAENKNEHEENTEAGTETNKPEDDCICIDEEDPCDKKQIQQDISTQQEQPDSEEHDVATNPDRDVTVLELQTEENSERTTVALQPHTVDLEVENRAAATETDLEVESRGAATETALEVESQAAATDIDLEVECLGAVTETGTDSSISNAMLSRNEGSAKRNYEEEKSSEGTSSVEEPPSEGCGRKRRAALKVTSFKEVSLNRKLRRGENDVIVIPDPEKKEKGRSRPRGKSDVKVIPDTEKKGRGRGRPRGVSRGRGKSSTSMVKTAETEVSP